MSGVSPLPALWIIEVHRYLRDQMSGEATHQDREHMRGKTETFCPTCFSLLPLFTQLLTLPPKSWTWEWLSWYFSPSPLLAGCKSDVSSFVPSPLSLGVPHKDNYGRFLTGLPPQTSLQSKFHVDFRDISQNHKYDHVTYMLKKKKLERVLNAFRINLNS